MEHMENYGHKIRMARTRLGVQSLDLAKELGWSSTKMSLIETGARRVTLQDAMLIANALGMSIKQVGDIKPNNTGERIADLRIGRGWDQKELARRVDVTQAQVSRWESGHSEPSSASAIRLSKIFEVSVRFLIGGVDNEEGWSSKTDKSVTISDLVEKLTEAEKKHPGIADGLLLLLEEGILNTPEDAQDLIDLVRIMNKRALRIRASSMARRWAHRKEWQ